VHYISGRILDASGSPVKNALVELWHCDAPTVNAGSAQCQYLYYAGAGRNPAMDANFAGFGQFVTAGSGVYKFRTIKAGLYNGRTRHYHIAVTFPGRTTRYCTQLGWNETAYATNGTAWATQNSNDNIFNSLTAAQKSLLLLNYTAVSGSTTGEMEAAFDFQVDLTPVEPTYPVAGGFVARGAPVAGPSGTTRFHVTFPAYSGYQYEVYANPTMEEPRGARFLFRSRRRACSIAIGTSQPRRPRSVFTLPNSRHRSVSTKCLTVRAAQTSECPERLSRNDAGGGAGFRSARPTAIRTAKRVAPSRTHATNRAVDSLRHGLPQAARIGNPRSAAAHAPVSFRLRAC
jgi:protocatechuate 3,4-dioxygenase beta subunit